MAKTTDEFKQQLQAAFRLEAQEQVQTLLDALVKLEAGGNDQERKQIIERSYRELHNLKGSARAVEFIAVETVCHPMEDVLSRLKAGKLEPAPELLDVLLEGICLVQRILEQEDADVDSSVIKALHGRLVPYLDGSTISEDSDEVEEPQMVIRSVTLTQEMESKSATESTPEAVRTNRSETLKIPADKLESFMQKAEEMLSIKAVSRQSSLSVAALQNDVEAYMKTWNKNAPEIKRARALIDKMKSQSTSPQEQYVFRKLFEIIELQGEFAAHLQTQLKGLVKTSHDHSHSTATAVDILLDETKRLLMMPCATLFEGFPLLVRQLARELGKEADINITGGDIEVDKRILSVLKDPLIHILRNSLDHGIEVPDVRVQKNKRRRASINLAVRHLDGSMVEILISDDGNGIDVNKVKETAVRMGVISVDDADHMSHDDALMLIFRSSLSTSPIITEISGRGLGMAIVEESIRRLGGRLKVESQLGHGTTFRIILPLTIATFRGVLVDVANKTFAIPTTSIDRVVRVKREDIKPVEGNDTILLGNSLVPLCRMDEALQLPDNVPLNDSQNLLTVGVLGSGDSRMGFIVDEVLEEQEVLVKSLGPVLSKVKNVSGVTILGSGKVVPILNVTDLLQMRRVSRGANHPQHQAAGAGGKLNVRPNDKSKTRILVVDDTLTARILLKNIFESASFTVKTANDGMDALNLLRNEQFDALVTDIEMPRMNGFELTESVRADARLKDLPIVMVTSMTSREDRERGVAAGANAYFVKSSFDQSNLLEVINSLV